MEKKKSATEVLASKYAEIFVELFDRIPSCPQEPFLAQEPFPQQNISGHVYSGRNALLTSLISTAKGYEYPIWLTFNQIKESGLVLNKGERGTPVAVYKYVLYDKATGKKSDIQEEEYKNMSSSERNKYEFKCFLRSPWYVFNLSQTNFKEAMPEQHTELMRMLGQPVAVNKAISEELVDRIIKEDAWKCPIRINENFIQPDYSFFKDVILSPPSNAFIDNSAYYSSMLYMMSQSTFHESRCDKKIDDLNINLSSQLSSAMLSSLLGVTSRIDHDNLSKLKRWSQDISNDPMVIFKAVNTAAKTTDIIGKELGIGIRKGVDFSGIFKEADKMLKEAKQEKNIKKNQNSNKSKSTFKLKR